MSRKQHLRERLINEARKYKANRLRLIRIHLRSCPAKDRRAWKKSLKYWKVVPIRFCAGYRSVWETAGLTVDEWLEIVATLETVWGSGRDASID